MVFRIEYGDKVPNWHIKGVNKNAHYTSPQVKNQIIDIIGEVLRYYSILTSANNSNGFSVIADETADLSGTEKLSIGVRFEDREGKAQIVKNFLDSFHLRTWAL